MGKTCLWETLLTVSGLSPVSTHTLMLHVLSSSITSGTSSCNLSSTPLHPTTRRLLSIATMRDWAVVLELLRDCFWILAARLCNNCLTHGCRHRCQPDLLMEFVVDIGREKSVSKRQSSQSITSHQSNLILKRIQNKTPTLDPTMSTKHPRLLSSYQ